MPQAKKTAKKATTKTPRKATAKKPSKLTAPTDIPTAVEAALTQLKRLATPAILRDMGPRYGIITSKALGVSMADIQKTAKPFGRHHALAHALWKTGWYEARLLAAFIADPAQLTTAEMDRWCRDFDNWGVCDTLCFKLFDQSPLAWSRIPAWATKRDEFAKRAAFALLACLALHDKAAPDDAFLDTLPLIEQASTDERNFVKKGVNWALRAIGRRNKALRTAATELATRLAASTNPTARWCGKDALRDLT